MELVLCSDHKKECYLKTGAKCGSNYGKSFYICSVHKSRCQFVQPCSMTARICDKHSPSIVELQAMIHKNNEKRCYYRCLERKQGTDWCGFKIMTTTTNDAPSFSSLSKTDHKAPIFKNEKKLEAKKDVKDANDSFTQWRDSPVKVTSKQNSEKVNLKNTLQRQKELLSRVQLAALPDKGARLKENINCLEKKIQNIDLSEKSSRMSKNCNEPQIVMVHPPEKPGGQTVHKTAIKSEWGIANKSGSTQIHKPHNSENKRETKLTEAFCLPKEFLGASSSNPFGQYAQLYGGRMTVKRLENVKKAMEEITASLHGQLKTCPKEDEEEEDPEGLKVTLMPHQKHALAWLLWRQKQQPSGGILADDMGLGKTLTMISLILKQKQEDDRLKKTVKEEWLKKDSSCVMKSKATLIITPASLVHQWGKEVESRCKRGLLSVLIYHGPNREQNVNKLASYDIVLTTYKIVSLEVGQKDDCKMAHQSIIDIEKNEAANEPAYVGKLPLLLQIHWKQIILDEAHDIRSYKSLTATAVTRLKSSSRWLLTGTPIQNKMLDMYSLLRFLRFSPFDEYKVWKNQVESNERTGIARLNTIIQTLLLRRTKNQTVNGKPLIKMTKKKLSCSKLTLSPKEQKLYDKIFKRIKSVVQDYINSHMDKDSLLTDSSSSAGNQMQKGASSSQSISIATKTATGKDILVFLLRLRQCCCHLSLLKESIDKEMGEDVLDLSLTDQLKDLTLQENEFKEYLDEDSKEESDIFSIKGQSTKIKAVIDILQEIYKNTEDKIKCVIVSQWTKLLAIVKYHVEQTGFSCHLLQGNVLPKKRSEIVEDFNTNSNGPEILLLSLKAGGVGLNLIGGSHLFLLDNHWNPALEEQACDRIYRVGQKHDVEIHQFVCLNTIEERIVTLQNRKRNLARDILSGSGQSTSRLELNDLRLLFGIK